MKTWIDSGNPYQQTLVKWKHELHMQSIAPGELKDFSRKSLIITEKIDGELSLLVVKGQPLVASAHGRIRMDLPLLEDAKKRFPQGTWIVGELVAWRNGKQPLPFGEQMSVMRKPGPGQEDWILFFPLRILKLGGKRYDDSIENYVQSFHELRNRIKGSHYLKLIKLIQGQAADLEKAYKKITGKGGEGVVFYEDGRVYKAKIEGTFDLAVIGVMEGEGRNAGKAGSLLTAFFDGELYRYAGNVGNFTDADREQWWSIAEDKSVGTQEGRRKILWIPPEVVIECKWQRFKIQQVPVYKYTPSGYMPMGTKRGAIMHGPPLFVRNRPDKSATNAADLRLSQIPGFDKSSPIVASSLINMKNVESFVQAEVISPGLLTFVQDPYPYLWEHGFTLKAGVIQWNPTKGWIITVPAASSPSGILYCAVSKEQSSTVRETGLREVNLAATKEVAGAFGSYFVNDFDLFAIDTSGVSLAQNDFYTTLKNNLLEDPLDASSLLYFTEELFNLFHGNLWMATRVPPQNMQSVNLTATEWNRGVPIGRTFRILRDSLAELLRHISATPEDILERSIDQPY